MFERILLPLDGSQLAEVAVPYVEFVARRLGSQLVLLHVCHSEHEPYRHMHQIYLDHMADIIRRRVGKGALKAEGARLQVEIISGEPADVIGDYVKANSITMVIMATCGGSGLKAWLLGSVADKVVRTVSAPTLLIRPKDDGPLVRGGKLISRILLPLDGSDASKRSVPYALELAKGLKTSITLFGMSEKPDYYSWYTSIAYTDRISAEYARIEAAAERELRAHLIEVEKELRQASVRVTHVLTRGIDPASEILEQEKKTGADLVVMATRGRSPIERWAFGSVAEKVLRQGDLPLLLVREAAG